MSKHPFKTVVQVKSFSLVAGYGRKHAPDPESKTLQSSVLLLEKTCANRWPQEGISITNAYGLDFCFYVATNLAPEPRTYKGLASFKLAHVHTHSALKNHRRALMTNLKYLPLADVNIAEPFFDSLKVDYVEFSSWFKKKADAGEAAYLFIHKGKIDGLLYLKIEEGTVEDIDPPLKAGRHLKIGTLKINAHGTKLGERFLKKVFDHALFLKVDDVYVTAFAKHTSLITILKRYGFFEVATKKAQMELKLSC